MEPPHHDKSAQDLSQLLPNHAAQRQTDLGEQGTASKNARQGKESMMDLSIYNQSGTQVGTMPVDEASLGGEVRPALLKQAFVMFHANTRQGSARTKSRGMVEGSTRKLYKQKGSGNARMGAARTVIRKGGGVAFAKTRTREDFRQTMPKKMRQLANRNALLAKLVDNEVKVIDSLDFAAPKTADFKQMLESVGVNRTCLVALAPSEENARRSARNCDSVDTVRIDQMNAFEMLNHRFVVISKSTLEAFLEGRASELALGAAKEAV